MQLPECQLNSIDSMGKQVGIAPTVEQMLRRLFNIIYRRIRALCILCMRIFKRQNNPGDCAAARESNLKAGDIVQVRSRAEIRATLDRWNKSKGCAFIDGMWDHCGKIYRVKKPVTRFLSDIDFKIKRCKEIVILDNVFCGGAKPFGRCDRSCFYFWRKEWLKKVETDSPENKEK